MAKSEKITKYRVLCVAVALGCSLFGILLGISLNLNSKDVISKEFVKDEDDLYEIQTMASRVIQESKINGYLCLSVHPLDYLSSSENTYHWRSCHALDGEYRAGNLSYMVDKSTIVCYLCDDKQVRLPRFPKSVPWNSKKWRMLLFVSDFRNALFAGRHYPFFSKSLMEEIRCRWVNLNKHKIRTDDINDMFLFSVKNSWSYWHNDAFKRITFSENLEDNYILSSNFIPMRDSIMRINDIITDAKNPLHFNDLLHSTCYEPYYCWEEYSRKPIHFSIGEEVFCPKCNESLLWNHEVMLCESCMCDSGYHCCEDCGQIVSDIVYIDNEERYVCRSCFEEYYFQCPYCGGYYHTDDGRFNYDNELYYCRHCYEELYG